MCPRLPSSLETLPHLAVRHYSKRFGLRTLVEQVRRGGRGKRGQEVEREALPRAHCVPRAGGGGETKAEEAACVICEIGRAFRTGNVHATWATPTRQQWVHNSDPICLPSVFLFRVIQPSFPLLSDLPPPPIPLLSGFHIPCRAQACWDLLANVEAYRKTALEVETFGRFLV